MRAQVDLFFTKPDLFFRKQTYFSQNISTSQKLDLTCAPLDLFLPETDLFFKKQF
jgi:hypothetical protein